ncbi:MAG: phosphoribosylformylglycinamidine synthase subunit PurQ [Saprospiraceae bacterium]
MKFGVVVFPGSNCDDDMVHVLTTVTGAQVEKIWHKTADLSGYSTNDCIVLPGGFSFGDYLRSGAIARYSPIMQSVIAFAEKGGLVIGICNGFQILCEAGLLPGVLLRNLNEKFICKNVTIKVENSNTPFTNRVPNEKVLTIPIAHAEGRFFAPDDVLREIENNNQVLFRYCDEEGQLQEDANPNGSINHIAGVCNANKNVFGMMPHPERAAEEILGNEDGRWLFESIFNQRTALANT